MIKIRIHHLPVTLGLIAAPPAVSAAETDADTAPEIIVTGRAETLYRVGETTAGKLPTDPLVSSQAITVITDDLIRDQGARDAQDLYRDISGVTVFSYAGVTARGFRQEENFYDGLRGDPYSGFSVPQTFNIERVEFLKGPAGMLYGQTAPGGLFNYVTKKPSFERSIELRGVLGTRDRIGGSAEATGPLTGNIAARAGVFYESRDDFRWNADSKTLILDTGLKADFDIGSLTLQATRYDIDLGGNRLRGVPADDDGNFLASRHWNHNEASDFLWLKSNVAQALLDLNPTDNLQLDLALRYIDAKESQEYHEPRGLFDADGDGIVDSTIREFRDQFRTYESWSFGANAIWSADLGMVQNRVLAGMDYYEDKGSLNYYRARGTTSAVPGLPTPLKLIDPDYGVTDPSTYDLTLIYPDNRPTRARRMGFYLLEEATIGRIVAVVGGRYDDYRDELQGDSSSGNAWTWRAGLTWRVRPDVSLFGQYATSFEPQSIAQQDPKAGGPFDPLTGDIFEAGIKTALFGGKVQSSLSAYRIRRSNVLQAHPDGDPGNDGIDDFVSFGEVTSKGIDLDLAADVTPDWVVTVNYAYNDTKITKDNGGGGFSSAIGDRFPNAPKHQLGFWSRYQFRSTGTAVALGGDYVSARRSMSDQRVKPYFVFDGSVIQQITPAISLLLRIDNIFDKTYASSGFIDRTGHFPGKPRSVFAELRWKL
ncbi:TonB-dependent siderophore receptor [Novosphingobium beihaiensis]|uniref:TonB-dependent receptor n=1 Tax=Novosphingobium beihaiensis TaxID=2930389 RepID=A0ABT0BTA7_9SPHN|nr:TonB-dependent receptor [Novosphingobium beihaiensis]MCJ2188293.1 TonB-dependent receptor [Novosphingobium beihaiensis]